MDVDTFLKLVANESERTIVIDTPQIPPGRMAGGPVRAGMTLAELLAGPVRSHARREIRYRHVLGAPARPGAIETWEARHPLHPLPADLRALVTRMNGAHLWATADTGRAYAGLAPIEEWEIARHKMYGASAEPSLLDDRYIAISYHRDDAAFIVLDVTTGAYYLMDTAGPDESCPIAHDADQLLDYLWRTRTPPAP